ncbi:hypothetical protein OPV22_007554 [Ensete ventricosum]|uniref:Uncharacterized protein n=1 Tax=Ensete ventricosum TaxID=4639 RepID=A0AAV8RUM3_ENSVE|nr:hypothetical protein OPV22_007554 [Ensete ventricosum]
MPAGPPQTRVSQRRLRLSLSLSRRRAMLSSPRVCPFWCPFFAAYIICSLSPGGGSALTAAFLLVMPFDAPSNYTYTAICPFGSKGFTVISLASRGVVA